MTLCNPVDCSTPCSCPPLPPMGCSNSCPLSWWCYLSHLLPPAFSSCLQSFPASGSLPMSELFTSGGQSTRVSALALPMNIQGWLPLGLTGLISLQSKGLSTVLSSTTIWKHHSSALSLLYGTTLTFKHDYWKTTALTIQTFVGKVMSLLFNMLSRFVIAFLPRSNRLLISWLQLPSVVILEPKKIESVTASTFSPSICMNWWDWMSWS